MGEVQPNNVYDHVLERLFLFLTTCYNAQCSKMPLVPYNDDDYGGGGGGHCSGSGGW